MTGTAALARETLPLSLARGTVRPAAPALPEAVRLAQAGDDGAFEQLYRSTVGRVHALCLRLTGDPVQAAERTQDVFVRAWEQLPTFRGESAFGSWLHRIAVNVVFAEGRAAGRRERRVAVSDPATLTERPGASPAPGATMDLERAIAGLPPGARQVFVLYDVEGYGHAEIANLMGIAEGTSKAQLFRARRLLREALDR